MQFKGEDLRDSVPNGLGPKDENKEELKKQWAHKAWSAITSFQPGSAGGPSGLRPIHLSECCHKDGPRSALVRAIASFAEVALTHAFRDSVREVLCASSLIPL